MVGKYFLKRASRWAIKYDSLYGVLASRTNDLVTQQPLRQRV